MQCRYLVRFRRFRCSIQRFRKEPVCGIGKSAETIMLLGIALEFILPVASLKLPDHPDPEDLAGCISQLSAPAHSPVQLMSGHPTSLHWGACLGSEPQQSRKSVWRSLTEKYWLSWQLSSWWTDCGCSRPSQAQLIRQKRLRNFIGGLVVDVCSSSLISSHQHQSSVLVEL